MDLPIEIITMDSLMKRWNMSFNDIVLIVLNQDLTPVYCKYPDEVWKKYGLEPDQDLLGVFLQSDVDPSRIIFLRSDIVQLEEKYGGQISKSKDVLNEKDLIERLGISEIELWNFQESYSLSVVDPLGIEINDFSNFELNLMSYSNYNKLEFYFRLSDIKRIEREHGLKSRRQDDTESETLNTNQDTKRHDDILDPP